MADSSQPLAAGSNGSMKATERSQGSSEPQSPASSNRNGGQRLGSYGALEQSTESLVSLRPDRPLTFRKRSSRGSRRNGEGDRDVSDRDADVVLHISLFEITIVHTMFLVGAGLLLVTVLATMLLLVNLVVPIPALLPRHRSPSLLSFWLFLLSLLILLPSLFSFELHPRLHKRTSALHTTNSFALLLLLILVSALQVYREGEIALALPAAILAWVSCAWAWAAGAVCEHVHQQHCLRRPPRAFHEEDVRPRNGSNASAAARSEASGDSERDPLLANTLLAYSPKPTPLHSRLRTSLRLLSVTLVTFSVTALLVMLLFDVGLTGADSAYAPSSDVGERVWVDLSQPSGTDSMNALGIGKHASVKSFRMHIKCENAWNSTFRGPVVDAANRRKKRPPVPRKSIRPTALVMTERGVSGIPASVWLREMVARASEEDGKDGDDGHLSLESVCYSDRLGYGFSDYLEGGSADIRLHTEALKRALEGVGAWTLPPPQPPSNSTDVAADDPRHFGGPFMLVSTGYGALYARHFAATHPEMVHSQLYIDAETPASWYTDRVSRESGLRAGYQAHGHRSVGLLIHDILPALLAPLGITHLLGLLAGRGPLDRVLSPRYRGGSSDFSGGGFRVLGAGGSSTKLLTTSLHERLDANQGTSSRNYRALVAPRVQALHEGALARKPTAVLSSFWKTHADVQGWGAEQRLALVRPALQQGGLVGWWRIGARGAAPGGGGSDRGGAQGICEEPQGRIFCAEAVRKILAAADLNDTIPPQTPPGNAALASTEDWQERLGQLTYDV